jgi:hypothetical protein
MKQQPAAMFLPAPGTEGPPFFLSGFKAKKAVRIFSHPVSPVIAL